MSLSINVPEPLATQLQTRAQAEQVPVDELASRLLESCIRATLPPEQWKTANARRVALIEKRFLSGLTSQEEEELQALQEMADRQLDELDQTLLRSVSELEVRAQQARRGAT